MKRVIFDTNVWNHILLECSIADRAAVRRLLAEHDAQLFLTEQNLDEILRKENDEKRRSVAQVIRETADQILPSAEFIECDELCDTLAQHRHDWSGKRDNGLAGQFCWLTWHKDLCVPAPLSAVVLESVARSDLDRKNVHEELQSANRTVPRSHWNSWTIPQVLAEIVPGCEQDGASDFWQSVEWGEITAEQWEGTFRFHLIQTFVELKKRTSVANCSAQEFAKLYFPRLRCSANEFAKWVLVDLAADALPTWRASFAAAAGQATQKFSKGNVGDQNFASYFPHVSLFVHCDKNLRKALASSALSRWIPDRARHVEQSPAALLQCLRTHLPVCVQVKSVELSVQTK